MGIEDGTSKGSAKAFDCVVVYFVEGGRSSAGRAPALQAGGRRFDPVRLHHFGSSSLLESRFCK